MIMMVFWHYFQQKKGFRKIVVLYRFLHNLDKIHKYVQEAKKFTSLGGQIFKLDPFLEEKKQVAGSFHGHYFWQDIIVAQWVLKQNKAKLADIGSRIDGYVSNVASSRQLIVIDIRPMNTQIPNVEFIQQDILSIQSKESFEIVTSLHTLEHIGLGRYGDQIDPQGHTKAFSALANLVVKDGSLVVSFPISSQTEVEFNGQRKIGFKEPLEWAKSLGLDLIQFIHLDSKDKLSYFFTVEELNNLIPESGTLGIYFFKKVVN